MPNNATPTRLPEGWSPIRILAEAEDRQVVVASDPFGQSRVFKLQRSDAMRGPDHPLAREYLLLDAMRHPHWVRPIDFGYLDRDLAFVAMEYSEGRPLRDRASEGWSNDTAELCRQILSGLEVLHTLGYAHLDLHPGQLLLEQSASPEDAAQMAPKILLLDLGLAAPFSTTLAPRGTPGFIAPEILESVGSWDRRADLFSFGALLFELLTGETLFRGSTPTAVLRAQFDLELGLDRLDTCAIPLAVQNVVRALLSPTPARRPGSAAETWHRLRETLPGQSELTVPPRLAVSSELPFVGRDAELATACAFIEDSFAAARSGVVLVTGERGIGKHRFLQRVAALARTRGWSVTQSDEQGDELVVESPPAAAFSSTPSVRLRVGDPSESALEIALPDLELAQLIDLARARGIETEDLRHRVARWSLGNPRLLAAGLAALPAQLDSQLSGASALTAEQALRQLEPPREWIEWSRMLQRRLPPERLRDVVFQAMLTLVTVESASVLGTPVNRGPLDTKSSGAAREPLWARAIVDALPDETVSAALAYLDSRPELAPPVIARVAIFSRSFDQIRKCVPGALSGLLREGRGAELLNLYTEAVSLAPDPATLFADEELEAIFASVIWVHGAAGAGVRRVWSDQTVDGESGVRTGLRAWACYARGEKQAGLDLLSAHRETRDSSWSLREFLWWRLLFVARGAVDFDREWTSDPVPEESVPPEVWLRLAGTRCEVLASLGRLDEAGVMLERLAHLVREANPAVRIAYWTSVGAIHWALGRMEQANVAFTNAIADANHCGLQDLAGPSLGGLGGLLYQSGDLPNAMTAVRGLAWDHVARGKSTEAAGALANLAGIQCQMGELGSAEISLRDAASLDVPHAANQSSSALLLWRVELAFLKGQYDRVISLAEELERSSFRDAGYYRPLTAARQGAARAILGDEQEGARHVYDALAELEQLGRLDDWAEVLSEWGLTVVLLDDPSLLLSSKQIVFGRARSLLRVQTVFDLIEGLQLSGASDAVERSRAIQLLLDASAVFESQQRRMYSWRADAALAALWSMEGRPAERRRHLKRAQTSLLLTAESLPYEADRELFFESLPVRRFFEMRD